MAYLEEVLFEFKNGAKIRRASWNEQRYITLKGCSGLNLAFYDVEADDWELYQEAIDWDYIIENRIPCWFWNIERKVLGILVDYNEDDMYLRDGDSYYQNCRPVHKDEITFYEDEKDGNI